MTMENKPVLVFGGTFNPPHYGHLYLIQYVMHHLEFSQVYIVPSFSPPHKSEYDSVSFDDRLHMTRILFKSRNLPGNIEISDMEKYLPVPSYSWRTLDYVHQKHPDKKLYMLIGMDMYLNLHQWENFKHLREKNNFIVFKRESFTPPEITAGDILLDNPFWNISSNNIRKIMYEFAKSGVQYSCPPGSLSNEDAKTLDKNPGDEIEKLVPPELISYILERRLYNP